MRTLITTEPFPGKSDTFSERGVWPASWISHPEVRAGEPAVTAFRRIFSIDRETRVRIHVSADERYELFLDGSRIGRGPERGDRRNWFYESYDLQLAEGNHTLVARTWWMGEKAAPYAQMTIRPGFILAAEGPWCEELSTGLAAWECKYLNGYEFLPVDRRIKWVGAKLRIRGSKICWDVERGSGEGWRPPHTLDPGISAAISNCTPLIWRLRPALLPPMLDCKISVGEARHVQSVATFNTSALLVKIDDHLPDEAEQWNRLLRGEAALTVPPRTMRRIIIDLGDYYCAFPEIIVSGGAGAILRIHWAESLFEAGQTPDQFVPMVFPHKGNRDEITGKLFSGVGDIFELEGGDRRSYQTLWWEAGRFLEIVVSTSDQPATIDQFLLRETHYPFEFDGHFECSEPTLTSIAPLALRTLQMCAHETYTDAPYYEQLMYVGDCRLEALTTYVVSRDDRLPRKALALIDESRLTNGLTQSRYPSRVTQVIPPFSLWWVAMVHDYAMWRSDWTFVAERMPGVRAVLEAFRRHVNRDGLLESPEGWNFTDWVPAWKDGVPPSADHGISSIINFQYIWILNLAAELEDAMGELELAARNRNLATRVARATGDVFWDNRRGIYADDLSLRHFSEHAQCMAVLSGAVPSSHRSRMVTGLMEAEGISQATIYFSHYLFEAFGILGLGDQIFKRLQPWLDLKRNGLRTTIEMPEPTRSDCHGWAAHPLFHFHASILGVRPAAFGFDRVRIKPQLGTLKWARGAMVHPKGMVRVDFALRDGNLTGTVEMPPNIVGELVHGEKRIPLRSTREHF